MSGKVIGLARREKSRAPMDVVPRLLLSPELGIEGDCKGVKFPNRQVTILAVEDWTAALADLAGTAGPPDLPWTTRRANILLENLSLPRGKGSIISIGDVVLEVMEQTTPCALMDFFQMGLREALAPHWRGGVTCRVIVGGVILLGDIALTTVENHERKVLLPG